MIKQDAKALLDTVTGTLSMSSNDAQVVIDMGTTCSFVSEEFVIHVGMPIII